MIKRSTWILLIVLVLVVGAYIFIKKRPATTAQATPTTGDLFLINTSAGTLMSLEVTDAQGKTFRMQRDLQNNWVITKPTTGAADQSLASAAETQVTALHIVAALDSPPDLGTIQLTKPVDTINLTFDTGAAHTVEVGALTPTSSGYYVRLDKGKIYVVTQTGIDPLLKLLASPPYPPTPTPAESETPQAVTTTPELATPTP